MIKEVFIPYYKQTIINYWEEPIFTDYGTDIAYKYRDVARYTMAMKSFFEMLDVEQRAKVSVCGKNSSHWALTYLGTVLNNRVIVPILPNFPSKDIQHIINHSDSEILFIDNEIFDEINEEALNKIKLIISLQSLEILYSSNDDIRTSMDQLYNAVTKLEVKDFVLPEQKDNSELMVILYTSGTTGFSKGVMLSYNNIMANMIYANDKFAFPKGDTILAFLPSAHAYGASFDFLYPFIRCNHIYFMSKIPSPKLLLRALSEVKPAVIEAVPLILEKIYHKKLKPTLNEPKMKLMLSLPGVNKLVYKKIKDKLMETFGGKLNEMIVGGAPMNHEVEIFLRKVGFPVTIGYGMSECAPLISYERWFERRIGSVGREVDYLHVKIDSPDPAKVPGEILIKGEQVMMGYYKNKEATQAVFTEDSWMRSGDIGIIDEDDFIFIKGRSKSMILGPAGENIYPEELEFTVNNLSCIQESLVIEKNGKIVAMIYIDMEEVDKLKLTEDKMLSLIEENRKEVNSNLPAYSRIHEFKIVTEPFQKTPTQKIKRYLYQ